MEASENIILLKVQATYFKKSKAFRCDIRIFFPIWYLLYDCYFEIIYMEMGSKILHMTLIVSNEQAFR